MPWILAGLAYSALAVLLTWPVAAHLSTAFPHDAFDPSLKPAVVTAHGRVEREIETLEKKLLHVWKRRQEESVQQIRRARAHLFPHGELQERVASYVGFGSRHGAWLTERLTDALQDPGAHELVSLGGSS